MSVDKLSEVRGAESESAKEDEMNEKKRKEKQQYIDDLQNQSHLNRRAIRRAMRFNFAENTALHKKRPLKFLRRGNEFSPSSSNYSTPPESREASQSPSPRKAKTSVKLRNPLRLMKQRSDFFDKQKLRRLELEVEESSTTTASPNRQSSIEKPKNKFLKKLSLDSVSRFPEAGVEDLPFSPVSYTRTQSSPADSPLNTMVRMYAVTMYRLYVCVDARVCMWMCVCW